MFGQAPSRVDRFETGLRHFVYDLAFEDGTAAVVRIGRADGEADIAGGIYWSKLLRPRGVPLPELIHADLSGQVVPFPFMVLERLKGRDLGAAYPEMMPQERRALAFGLAKVQSRATSLGPANGYGFAFSLDGPFPQRSWSALIESQLARSRGWIQRAGQFDRAPVERVARAAERFEDYFRTVEPIPFLHDMTTKNVLIDDGALTGLVDVDDLCFGDPLFLLGLINIALQAGGLDLAYVEDWKDALSFTPRDDAVLALYTALFAVTFLGEIGQRFNRTDPLVAAPSYVARLERALEAALNGSRGRF